MKEFKYVVNGYTVTTRHKLSEEELNNLEIYMMNHMYNTNRKWDNE